MSVEKKLRVLSVSIFVFVILLFVYKKRIIKNITEKCNFFPEKIVLATFTTVGTKLS